MIASHGYIIWLQVTNELLSEASSSSKVVREHCANAEGIFDWLPTNRCSMVCWLTFISVHSTSIASTAQSHYYSGSIALVLLNE